MYSAVVHYHIHTPTTTLTNILLLLLVLLLLLLLLIDILLLLLVLCTSFIIKTNTSLNTTMYTVTKSWIFQDGADQKLLVTSCFEQEN
jgi:hypothetical protein